MADAPMKLGMRPPHPGTFVREEVLEPLGLSMAKMAGALEVRRATLSDFLNGKSSLSPEMALRLEKAFGVDMEMLLRMQAWYDTRQMRDRADELPIKRYAADEAA
jgi:addiction module HigA family antidote